MSQFLKCFVRDASGAWRCTAFAMRAHRSGRVQVTEGRVFVKGPRFMNVDLAAVGRGRGVGPPRNPIFRMGQRK